VGVRGKTRFARARSQSEQNGTESFHCSHISEQLNSLQLCIILIFMRQPLHPAKSQISLPNVLFALSDPTRLQIIKGIAEHDQVNCCDIKLDLSKSTASRHFRVLREAGIIRMEPRGVVCINSLRRHELDELFPGLLDSVLHAAGPSRKGSVKRLKRE
jgi:DNA-binding transcriptional ArsR family regulator